MRQLKHHEQKLLKKVDLLAWKGETNHREVAALRRYLIQDRDDYKKYNRLTGMVTKLTNILRQLGKDDPTRIELTEKLLHKLYDAGIIPLKKSLEQTETLATSTFCRRRLPIVLVRLKFAETVKEAVTFVEHGHIRVGPEVVTNPAFHVTRTMEDFITWTNTSKIRRKVDSYNDRLDDYDLT